MAKNKKQQNQQLLSPENYIRQKARKLPVFECLINDEWNEIGTAQIVVSRSHVNGNLTFAMYLVDLLCLGVKDTFYQFNASEEDYNELLQEMEKTLKMNETDYALVHNIIFASNEFAAELGFKPHKDFTSVSQYLLEEDTDDIELIEIECGKNGKPMFIKTEQTTEADAARIIRQLEKAVGHGNFDVILGGDEYDEMEEDDERENEFNDMDKDEKIKLFRKLTAGNLDILTNDEKKQLIILTESIYSMDICDSNQVDYYLNRWSAESEMPIDEAEYTPEILGLEPGREITEAEEAELAELDYLINEKPRKVEKYLKELKKKWGNNPYLLSKELKYLELNEPKEYEKKLKEYGAQFGDYPLIKMEIHKHNVLNSAEPEKCEPIAFEEIFQSRKSITDTEMFEFQINKQITLIPRNNFNEFEAVYRLVDTLNLSDEYFNYLKTIIALTRINILKVHLETQD